jgi:hypothetical protein
MNNECYQACFMWYYSHYLKDHVQQQKKQSQDGVLRHSSDLRNESSTSMSQDLLIDRPA